MISRLSSEGVVGMNQARIRCTLSFLHILAEQTVLWGALLSGSDPLWVDLRLLGLVGLGQEVYL